MTTPQVQDAYELSPVQAGMLFDTQLDPAAGLYVVQLWTTLSGAVDEDAFRAAWAWAAERHPALRTGIVSAGVSRPVQVVHGRVAIPLRSLDWRGADATETERRMSELLREDRALGFDLARPPLLRLALVRTADDEHLLLCTLHHLVLDGWSHGTLLREVMARYAATVSGAEYDPPAPRPYKDFIGWLRGRDRGAAEAFWRRALAGITGPTPLGIDAGPAGGAEPGVHDLHLDAHASAALQDAARAHRVTPATLFQAAWALVLARYAGRDDVVFGSTAAGRPEDLSGAQRMVGLFINTLPARVRVEDDAPVGAWLREVQAGQLAAREHEHTPLVDVQGWTEVPRGRPLFESILTVENLRRVDAEAAAGGLAVGPLKGSSRTGYPLSLVVVPGERVHLRAYPDPARIPAPAAERLLKHLATALAAIAAAPAEARLGALDVLGEDERRALAAWNETERAHPVETVHAAFRAQAARTPDAVAIAAAGRETTFAALDAETDRLSRVLRARGVGAEDRVAVCLERGLELPAALLAVLKAGAAYVPLDPAAPAERLAWVLEDCGASLVVTHSSLAAALPASVPALLVDEAQDEIAAQIETPLADAAGPDQAAYVIYTSGSTGRPKGVVVPHRALRNHMAWMLERFPLGAGDRVLQKTPVTFDASVWEFWAPLLSGARLVMAAPGTEKDGGALVAALADERITVLQVVPSLLRVLADEPALERADALRLLFCGGEALSAEVVAQVSARIRPEIHNLYGPTEACIDASSHRADGAAAGIVPIGGPIDNTRLYVLDGALRQVPVGVPGELYVAGQGLARGYLGRAGLTAERFVADPFAAAPGARMYRTGDRVRRREDGTLDYLGRIDFQVKVRGHRVEPGEIEAVLAELAAVREAVVVAREDGAGTRLVAYVVAAGDAPSVDELRRALASRLPEYMVPAAFVVLDAFPLTPSGKTDRRALPAPDAQAQAEAGYVAPRTETEELLAALWAEVLGVERAGAEDSLFALGGHSLQAMQLASRIRDALRVELAVRTLFDAPTPAALAASLATAESAPGRVERTARLARVVRRMDDAEVRALLESTAGAARGRTEGARRQALMDHLLRAEGIVSTGVATIAPREDDGPAPLSFAQERLWLIDRLQPGLFAYNISTGLRIRGALDADVLARALTELVRRHEALRTRLVETDGAAVQVIDPAGVIHLPLIELADEAMLRERASALAARPFDLAADTPLRAELVRLSADEHVLVLVIHHTAIDGWSTSLLFRELDALYVAFARGQASPLAETPIRYADYAAWQRAHLDGAALDGELAWWRERLAGLPGVLELPADRPRPTVATHRGGVHRLMWDRELADGLRELARREGATLFMTLLAGFQALLHRWTGEADFAIGTPVAGRTRPETEGLVGLFVNTLVLRADVSAEPDFRALLRRVREATLGAWAHQDAPFERLVDAVGAERSLDRNPLFQVMFALQNAGDLRPRLAGLDVQPFRVHGGGALLDLTCSLTETEGGIEGVLEYSADLFDAPTIERMAEHLRVLLAAAVADASTPVAALPLLADAERARIAAWETEPAIDADPLPFPARFTAQVKRAPDAPALWFAGQTVSYGEMDARASRLANHLRGLGVGPESRVGVCLERTPELIVTLLAVLKAGAAYVPLEPHFPADRIAAVLADAGAALLITGEAKAGALALPCPALAIDAADVRQAIDAESGDAPIVVIHPDHLAHVIYTSGSTGAPKGVMIRHGGIAAFLSWMRVQFPVAAGEKVLGSTSVCFDVHAAEVHHTLSSGGTLVLVANALSLAELPAELGIVQASMVPTAAQELLHLAALPGSIRRLNLGGEPVPGDLARALYAAGVPEVRNLYGPTEDTTYSTHSLIPADGRVTVGRQIAGSRAYVLDGRMQLVPVGVVGDLYLAGDGVSRGYLAQPGMTAERYIPDVRVAGERMYTTGDRARWLPNGELEYLGRSDFQVKVRGYRIEPGEIEAVLRAHPAVENAAVAARGEASARRLVAWIVAGGAAPSSAELADWVRARLPEYMVPEAFAVVDAFPRTTSGKVDRRALPEPAAAPVAAEAFVAPRTETESLLAGIWSQVLGVDTVGANDAFFALGGHSLRATRVTSRVRQVMGVEMPLRAVFEHVTLAALAKAVDGLRAVGAATPPPVVPVDRDGPLPLSFAQQRLWFLEQLEPGSPAYNVPIALRLSGDLDDAALSRALAEIVRRHEALRTTFVADGAEARQVIAPAADFDLPLEDLSAQADPQAAALARAVEEAEAPFDLARGPLFRARLLRVAADEHVLLLTLHHAVSDGWSMGVLLRELGALYETYKNGAESLLAPPSVQYADYAAWQRRVLDGPAGETQLAYWKARLAGAPTVLELPTDRPRPAVQTYRGAVERMELPAEVADAVRAAGRREGATTFMTLLAAYQALLARHAGQDDVVVGSPIAGRTRGETEGLIGLFVNTLALRGDLSGDPTFRELLARVRQATLDAYAHQDLPFERLVEAVQPERSLGHSPVFQAFFVLNDAADLTLRIPGVRAERLPVEESTVKFDLSLAATDGAEGLRLSLHYNRDLWEPATIRRMLEQLGMILAAGVAEPELRVSALPLLTDAERAGIAAWQAGPALPPAIASFPAQFAARVAETPDAVALVHGMDEITYAELDARANRLARHLRRLGVGPEVRAGMAMERTPELVVALLGILKSGGAYVPMEPHFPADRIAAVLADAGARVFVASASLIDRIDLPDGCHALAVDDPRVRAAIDAESVEALEIGIHPESLAHVIYTSGSTGKPKGVMIRHGAVAAFIAWMAERFPLAAGERVLASTSVSFDVHVAETHFALAAGAQLLLVDDALAAAELPADARVAQASMVPTAARELLALDRVPAGLRRMNLAGEALSADLVRALYAAGVAEVHNLYGPTEDTTYATHGHCAADGRVTIGRSFAGRRAYVLDGALRPVPVGVVGDLYLAGCGVARGYLGRPDLTAERFVPDPFGEAGERMYAAGDRARWLANGELEYLGRADLQLKIRGFRIEPGEVESVLRAHASVADAVAAAHGAGVSKRLVAWVVARDGESVDAAALAAHTRETLPSYMVPAAFVPLDAFPRTASGKVDRNALPSPDFSADADTWVAPRTAAEQALAEIWAEVLGVERVGVEDDFFALGGHSLLATRVVSRVRQALDAELPLRAVFEHPTVARLAARIQASAAAAQPIIPAADRGAPLPLSFAQRRLWFIDQLEPGSALYNLPLALTLAGALDVPALERALGEIVRRHEPLRTRFAVVDGEPVQRIDPAGAFVLPVESFVDEAAALERARQEAAAPFDLARGPLFRARLLRVADDRHVLLATFHHAIGDGWSMGVFLRELSALYAAFRRGGAAPLAPLAVQYADYAAWERRALAGDGLSAPLAWWRARLAGAPAVLEIPTDRPRAAGQDHAGAGEQITLPAETLRALHALARREGATLFMTLLAAWQVLLSRLSGQDDVVVGTPVAGRGRSETEGMIGFFANMLPVRTDLAGAPAFRTLLGRVREETLQALAHGELPFEKLVEEVQPERSLAHSPLFQAVFVLEDADARPALDGVDAERLRLGERTAKFDLSLGAAEGTDGLTLGISYRTALFDARSVRRMLTQLRMLVEAAAADPDRSIVELPLLDEAEVERLRVLQPGPAVDDARTFPDRFAARVRVQPDAPALVFGGETLTYAQLDARANRLANHLRALGIGTDARVGVCLARTPELIVALLGVLKAGAAYVPLEPRFPADRIVSVLRAAGAPLLIAETDDPAIAGSIRILSPTDPAIAASSAGAPRVAVQPEALAHVIYTSGSTGTPKGVMIRHASVGAFLDWTANRFGVRPGERVLGSTSVCFDVHVAEVHHTLASGATLVLVENALSVAELPADAEIVQASMVPTAAQELLAMGALPTTLKRLNLGGEPVAPDLARDLYAAGIREVHNLYGPTEDTTYSTHSLIPADGAVTIGRPIGGRVAYVLDARLQPVPAGVTGDLYLAGCGLSRGYLARPDLTAERYLPDPSGTPGARMYATGDRVRWLPSGELECFGRADFQLKVRGYRIEPGEIEGVLRGHPAVLNAAVGVRGEGAARRLVAWTLSDGAAADGAELAAYVRARLPEYMVPAAFVAMDAFPLTTSGKVDRKALPDPDFTADEAAYVAPRTATEAALAEIWTEVLGVERAGAEDDFFALGGHSLIATQVVSRVQRALGAAMPLRAVFEAPTLAAFAARIDEALGTTTGEANAAPPLVRGADGDRPLSFAQERLWFLEQLQPGTSVYNVPLAMDVDGPLDADALARALDEIVRRHQALRTAFVANEDGPLQRVIPAGAFVVVHDDLSALPAAAAEAEAARRVAEESQRPFDLETGPLVRARLLRHAPERHTLVLVFHHAAFDAWSTGVLTRELAALYGAFARGEASPLAEPAVQYADFAVWQRAWLTADELERQLAYWREALRAAPATLDLPADRPRPAVQDLAGGTHRFALSAEAAEAAHALARMEGATPFMALTAAFTAVLHRWTGQDDLVVGTPMANRARPELEGLIGFFSNTLALRADLSGAPGFRTLLRRVRERTLQAYAHQDVPFERLVDELKVERSMSHAPLFQVMFTVQNAPRGELALGDARVRQRAAELGTSRYDLTVSLTEGDAGLRGWVEYATALYDESTVARMMAHLDALLVAAAQSPDAPVAALDLLPEAERAAVVDRFNATDRPEWDAGCVHGLVAAQAARTPDAVAVEFDGERLTYAQLEARANRIAHALRRIGVGADARVAVCLDRSLDLPVAVLAVLKAGAGYVAVDPGYPADRVASMLEDSRAAVLVTTSDVEARLPRTETATLLLDGDAESIAAESDAAPAVAVHPLNLCYVLYTSGSTGRPKGAALPHRTLVNLLRWQLDRCGGAAAARTLQFASLSFDVSFQEIFSTWAAGGTLVGVDDETRRDAEALLAHLRAERVGRLFLPFAALQNLAESAEGADARLPALREVITAGEALRSTPQLRAFFAGNPGLSLDNQYGPSETHVISAHLLGMDAAAWPLLPPIGPPIGNVRLYVLDGRMQPAPLGVPGELYAGGVALARGYLGRPGMTAEKFVPDPFSAQPGARLYRTGDRARWLAGGELEYIGRTDFQVKIRGFRVEPGEVEAALGTHPAVREAAVAVRGEGAAKRLVAYIVPVQGESPTAAELRAHVAAGLPEHMVPGGWVTMEALPLTPSGKVDRRALPEPDPAAPEAASVAPRTAPEAVVAAVWAEVLGAAHVGVHDDFFDLGGHSLLATRAVSQLRRTLCVEVPLRWMFEAPTVARLCERMAAEPGMGELVQEVAELLLSDDGELDEADEMLAEGVAE